MGKFKSFRNKLLAALLGAAMVFGSVGTVVSSPATTAYAAAKKLKAPKIKKTSSAKNSVTIKWKKVAGADKYGVFQYVPGKWKVDKNGVWKLSSAKWKRVKYLSKSKTSVKIKGLKANTTYKFKVAAYDKVGKKYVRGKFSAVKKIKTKKAASSPNAPNSPPSSAGSSGVSSSKPASASSNTGSSSAKPVSSSKPAASSIASSSKPASSKPSSSSSSSSSTPVSSSSSSSSSDTPSVIPAATSGLDFIKNLKVGWNLGNSFDSINCTWVSDELDYESGWCGEKASQALIDAIYDAGFRTIRMPVSWHEHVSTDGNYTISQRWLDRVNEVVDMCVNKGMYVILNIHHDNEPNAAAGFFPNSANLEKSKNYVKAIWKQLSERFKDYDEHLIFETLNEPRLIGSGYEWQVPSGVAEVDEAIDCINQLNQLAVDTIRATGGNNSTRYITCPGYCAKPEAALKDNFILPTDPNTENNNHIFVTVHAYEPYDLALNTSGTDKWDKNSQIWNITNFMDQLNINFIQNGIPVIIDEFGVLNKNNLQDRIDCTAAYVSYASSKGLTCVWWDNNAFDGSGENFGLIDRATCEWRFYEIVEAIMNNL